jgi:hypothetical protein
VKEDSLSKDKPKRKNLSRICCLLYNLRSKKEEKRMKLRKDNNKNICNILNN